MTTVRGEGVRQTGVALALSSWDKPARDLSERNTCLMSSDKRVFVGMLSYQDGGIAVSGIYGLCGSSTRSRSLRASASAMGLQGQALGVAAASFLTTTRTQLTQLRQFLTLATCNIGGTRRRCSCTAH